jgi:hypothetical protein
MAQGVLPFKYEAEKNRSGMTALAGLPTYLELASVCGLQASIARHMGVRRGTQGWSDTQMLMSLILLNLAGGDCVDDLSLLHGDPGFAELMYEVETHGMPRRERRALVRRFRRERKTALPSPSSVFRYLSAFHDPNGAVDRQPHKAFIPAAGEHLRGLARVNADVVAFVQKHTPHKHATLDQDATLVETNKAEALFSYKHFRAYQPLNTYWAEHDLMLHSEFRDGNVPAGFEQLRVLQDALALLPDDVETVSLRSDSAGYQIELLKYCAEGKNARFGVIEFAISADVNAEFRRAALAADVIWKPLCDAAGRPNKDEQEYAEVAFVPAWIGNGRKDAPEYRFLAIREPMPQLELPHVKELKFPFQTLEFGNAGRFKLFGVVTNRLTTPGDALIRWHRERCGMSEKAHAVMKDDLAGGKMPSALFGVNAAWWATMIIAMNLNTAMKRLVLGAEWATRRMKAIRLNLIALPGQLITHGRQLIVRLATGHRSNELLIRVRQAILALAAVPSG